MIRFIVEYNDPNSDDEWFVDRSFPSLEEAVTFAALEATQSMALEHRVCKMTETAVVVTLPPLGDH